MTCAASPSDAKNHLGVERCVAAGDPGVERDCRTGALVRVDGSEHLGLPAEREVS